MKFPFFTIIIPTYNRADLIIRTLKSVLDQSFQDFEVIIVDNKSTDNTVEVLEPYLKENVRLFVQEKNFERARSRNKGIEVAKGKFVSLLDSDDILYHDCLQDAYNYYSEHQSVQFFHCGSEVTDINNKVFSRSSLKEIKNPFRELSQGNYISNIGIFIDRDVANSLRYDETPELIGMEDYDFLLRLLYMTKRIGFIKKINCGILLHPQRTVLTQEMKTIETRVKYFVKKNLNSEPFKNDFAPYKKIFLASNQLYLCGAAAIRGLIRKAFIFLIKAAKSNPRGLLTYKFWQHFLVIIKYSFK